MNKHSQAKNRLVYSRNFLNKIIFLLCSLPLTLSLHAQALISGVVKDGQSHPIAAATVRLIKLADSTLVAQTFTEEDGRFSLSGTQNQVVLVVSSLGYHTYSSSPFDGSFSKSFGAITLTDAMQHLADVVVTAEKKRDVIEQKNGKLIYKVGNSISATGSNAYELLKKVPGVSIDGGAQTVKYNGRGNTLVLINGRPTYMQPAELVALLRSTASSNIKSVEVMSNATAQYDAEGSGAVFNIVLKKPLNKGWHLMVNNGFSYWFNPKVNTEVAFNYNHKKFNLYANYSHTFGYNALFYGGRRTQGGKLFDAKSDDTDKRKTVSFTTGMDYSLSAKQMVGVQFSSNFIFGPGIIKTHNSVFDETSQAPLYSIYSESDFCHQFSGRYNFNANYIYKPSDEKELKVEVDYGWFDGDNKNKQPNTYYSPSLHVDSVHNYYSFGERDIDFYAVSSSWKQPLFSGELNVGAKFSGVSSGNKYGFYDTTSGAYVMDVDASNNFKYSESVLAGYLMFSKKFSTKWDLNLGVRAEQTFSDAHLIPWEGSHQQSSHVKRHYLNFFPSFAITHHFRNDHSLGLSMGSRIDRPVYSDLNPIEQPLDGLSMWQGNPFLQPQRTGRLELLYTWRKTSVGLSCSRTFDYFVGIIDTLGVDKTVMKPMNLGKQTYYGLMASQSLRLFKSVDVDFTGNVYHLDNQLAFDAVRRYHLNRWAYNASLHVAFPLPWKIKSEITGTYISRRLGGSTDISEPTGNVDLALMRKFLKDKLTVSLAFNDIFWTSNWDGVNKTTAFTDIGYGYMESRMVKLNVTLNLGGGKKKELQPSNIDDAINRL